MNLKGTQPGRTVCVFRQTTFRNHDSSAIRRPAHFDRQAICDDKINETRAGGNRPMMVIASAHLLVGERSVKLWQSHRKARGVDHTATCPRRAGSLQDFFYSAPASGYLQGDRLVQDDHRRQTVHGRDVSVQASPTTTLCVTAIPYPAFLHIDRNGYSRYSFRGL